MILSVYFTWYLMFNVKLCSTRLTKCAATTLRMLNKYCTGTAAPIRLRWHSHNENYSRRWRRQPKIYVPFQIMKYRYFMYEIDVSHCYSYCHSDRCLCHHHTLLSRFSPTFFFSSSISSTFSLCVHFIISCRKMTFYE